MKINDASVIIRKKILDISYNTGMAHIGTALSCVEILNSIYAEMDIEKVKQKHAERDRVILSKGHGITALYACLNFYNLMSEDQIADINKDNSFFGGHPPIGVDFIEHPTGALGHGASVGVGMAFAMKELQKNKGRVFVILGDGELHEGSNWEAFMQASTLHLDNLYFIVDRNRLSGIDSSSCCELENLEKKLLAFGLNTSCIDGHNEQELIFCVKHNIKKNVPNAIICETIKGKGVSFMENNNIWHYRPLSKDTYEMAYKEVCLNEKSIF